MDWLMLDIYNILLDKLNDEDATEMAEVICDRIRNPENYSHILG